MVTNGRADAHEGTSEPISSDKSDSERLLEAAEAGLEQEYHTEESDDDNDQIGPMASDEESDGVKATAQLLPAHLLKSVPYDAVVHDADAPTETLPWNQTTRKQKEALRNRGRHAKKRLYDRLREGVKGTGVVAAGKAAQRKRDVGEKARRERVSSGRIGKSERVLVSGREMLLEQRKRAASNQDGGRRMKKGKKR